MAGKSTKGGGGYSFDPVTGSILAGEGSVATVRAATTGNIADLAAGAPDPLDGINLAVGDIVFVKDQADQTTQGIYRIDVVGAGATGEWTRAARFNEAAELEALSLIWVRSGTINAETLWGNTTDPVITVGVTNITFILLSGSGDFVTVTAITFADTPYAVLAADEYITVNATGGNTEADLPAIGGTGRRLHIVKTDATANTVTVDGNGAETINGVATQVLNVQYQTLTIWDNGTEWSIE